MKICRANRNSIESQFYNYIKIGKKFIGECNEKLSAFYLNYW